MPTLWIACILIVSTPLNQTTDQLSQQTIRELLKLVGETTVNKPVIVRHAHFIEARSGRWALVVDGYGRVGLRLNTLASEMGGRLEGGTHSAVMPPQDRDKTARDLLERTRRLWNLISNAPAGSDANVTVKQELIVSASRGDGRITEHWARWLVRLSEPSGERFFQVQYDAVGRVIRVDTTIPSVNAGRRLADRIATVTRRENRLAPAKNDAPLTLGTFFDPDEARFEIAARSYEGEAFLDPASTSNPFTRDQTGLDPTKRADVDKYRKSGDYHYWCWHWWNLYGRVNGLRGNQVGGTKSKRWEFPRRSVVVHRSLCGYELEDGESVQSGSNGGKTVHPHGTSLHLEKQFYEDLDKCQVAVLFAHGGIVDGRYQFRRNLDVWIDLRAPNGRTLGTGQLRHLFLEGCGAMTYRKKGEQAHLLETWMQSSRSGGLRTVSGFDGEAVGLDRNGWRFFGYYNKGESVSDSWAMALIDECLENSPVTVAFGDTENEAIKTLLEGRFADQRAGATWAVASVWTNLELAGAIPRP